MKKQKNNGTEGQIMTDRDVEHLDLNIYWGALSEEEQLALHQLLSKAHQGYERVKENVKR